MTIMSAEKCVLVSADYQVRLMPAIHEESQVAGIAQLLGPAARLLSIGVLGTEQNPDKLGPNLEHVKAGCDRTLPKTHFDAGKDGLLAALEDANPGVRAGRHRRVRSLRLHDADGAGTTRQRKRVWVVANTCSSRRPGDHAAAMGGLAQAGATIVTHEMVIFE